MIKATQLTEKSWLLTKKRTRVGIMRREEESYSIMGGPFSGKYDDFETLEKKTNETFNFEEKKIKEELEPVFLEGYPVKVDEVFDVNTECGYPTYTKRIGSSDIYAAGYWCINFKENWHGHYCPRNKTLNENEHIGPLKTKLEMDHSLRIENNK